MCCSNFAVVDHVVYSLWVGWCLFRSGTLPLMLHKFIKTVSFQTFFRKTPRWAKPIPTAGENPLLITLWTKTQVMVPNWFKKLQNGPASFWDLYSSYLAQSSYLVRNSTNINYDNNSNNNSLPKGDSRSGYWSATTDRLLVPRARI